MMRALSITLARALAGAAVALALALTVPLAFHGRPLVVLSGSMEPALHVGDVVIVQRIAPLKARVGDIVTFKDPARGGVLVTHRVRAERVVGSEVRFVTQGDANNATEHWSVHAGDTISRSEVAIPKIGYVLMFLHRSTGRIVFCLLLALALAAELVTIWKPDKKARDRVPVSD
jgi:signal peptidase